MFKRIAVLLLACILLAGCSGQKTVLPGMTVQEGKDGTVTVETKDGSLQVSSADGNSKAKVPEGFPHKLMDGYVVEGAMKATSGGKASYTLALAYSGKETKKVADFYEAELKGLGISSPSRSEMSDSTTGTTIFLNGDSDKVGAWISITEDLEQKKVQVSLIYGMK